MNYCHSLVGDNGWAFYVTLCGQMFPVVCLQNHVSSLYVFKMH